MRSMENDGKNQKRTSAREEDNAREREREGEGCVAAHLLPSERERNKKLQLTRAYAFCPAAGRCCRPPAAEPCGRALFPLKNGGSCRSKSTEQSSASGEGGRKAEQCIRAEPEWRCRDREFERSKAF